MRTTPVCQLDRMCQLEFARRCAVSDWGSGHPAWPPRQSAAGGPPCTVMKGPGEVPDICASARNGHGLTLWPALMDLVCLGLSHSQVAPELPGVILAHRATAFPSETAWKPKSHHRPGRSLSTDCRQSCEEIRPGNPRKGGLCGDPAECSPVLCLHPVYPQSDTRTCVSGSGLASNAERTLAATAQ